MSTEESRSGRAAGGQLEERHDLSNETTEKIAQATTLIQSSPSNLSEALALMAALEKRCRVGNDNSSLVRVCESSLKLCHECGDNDALLSTLKTLATRRSQKSAAVSKLVHTALPWVLKTEEDGTSIVGIGVPVDASTDNEKKNRDNLVVALRDITDGKLFLEAERARLTRALAAIKVRTLFYSPQLGIHLKGYGPVFKLSLEACKLISIWRLFPPLNLPCSLL
jgi:26S proteasome regulatory subunit N5